LGPSAFTGPGARNTRRDMLKNGSFEEGWTDKTQSVQEPNGWTVDWTDEPTFDGWQTHAPELVLRSRDHLPEHEHDDYIVDGDWCAKLFAGHKAFHAFLWQDVRLEPGRYRFTVNCFVDTFVWDDGKVPPQANEEPMKRAARLCLYAGDDHAWFDESREGWYLNSHELSLEFAVEEGGDVEVGVEVWNPWPVDNNGWFFDAFSLERIDEPKRYKMHVLPDYPLEQALELVVEGETFGWSWRHAGTLGHAVLHDVPKQDRDDVREWFAAEYPDAVVEFAGAPDWKPWDADISGSLATNDDCPPPLEDGWWQRMLEQIDGVTVHHTLSHSPHATAAYYVTKGGGRPSIPYHVWVTETGQVLKCLDFTEGCWHDHTGHQNTHLSVGMAGDRRQPPSEAQLSALVRFCTWCLDNLNVDEVRGHKDYVATVCPGWDEGGWKAEFYRRLGQEPEPDGEPGFDAPTQMLGMQQQRAGRKRNEFIERVKPDYWKLIGGMGEARHLLSLHPGMKVIYRHFENDWGKYVLADDKDKAAREFVAQFRDSLEHYADVIHGIEGLNEWIATNDYRTLQHASGWVRAFCAELDRIGMPAVPVTFNTAVGNPQTDAICKQEGIPSQVAYMVDGVRATIEANGYVGYHSYYGVRQTGQGSYYCTLDGQERRYYSLRALLEWDPHFRAEGLHPRYLFTEGGPIYVAPWGGMPSAYAGWRADECFGGDMQWRREQAAVTLLQFLSLVEDWNGEHGNRARGLLNFLHGGMGEWTDFEWEGEPGLYLAGVLT